MAKRIGFYTLGRLAQQMCKYIVKFTPAIRSVYPDNTLLLAALEAANVACAELEKQISLQAEPGT